MADRRTSEAPRVPRDRWVRTLHRKPTRWDVLLHKLAEAMVRRYWFTQVHFRHDVLHLVSDELWDCSIHMARAFGKQTTQAGIGKLIGKPQVSIFTMDRPGAMDQLVAEGAACMRSAALNYLEIAHNCFLKRNHPDLELLMPRIIESMRRFLTDKCSPEGELYPCIQNPLGDDEGYFPATDLPPDPLDSSGNPALDAYRLNVLVHDEDDAGTMLRKLVNFAASDPYVAPEHAVEIVGRFAARQMQAQQQGRTVDEAAEVIHIRNRFLFTPCRQEGLTPAELFAQQHVLASDRQKERLERWAKQNVDGVFRIVGRTDEQIVLRDISSGRDLGAWPDPSLAYIQDEQLFRARMLPWDDTWLLSGTAQLVDERISDESALRAGLHPLYVCRAADDDDPRLARARELVEWIHAQFIARFGGELALFDTIEQCRSAMGEFHHWLLIEARLEDGKQFADVWRAEVAADFPPFNEDQLGANDEHFDSPGVIYDARHGMAFLPNAGEIRLAMTSPFPAATQKTAFARMLLEKWRPGWLVQKIAKGHAERAQEIISDFLGDDDFDIERDLQPLLGRLKCPNHTLPDRPVPFVAT